MVPILKKANNGLPPIFLWRDRHAGQIYDKRVIPESSPFFGIIRGIVIECSMGSLAICNSVQFNGFEVPKKNRITKKRDFESSTRGDCQSLKLTGVTNLED